jgi:hypothetical protein
MASPNQQEPGVTQKSSSTSSSAGQKEVLKQLQTITLQQKSLKDSLQQALKQQSQFKRSLENSIKNSRTQSIQLTKVEEKLTQGQTNLYLVGAFSIVNLVCLVVLIRRSFSKVGKVSQVQRTEKSSKQDQVPADLSSDLINQYEQKLEDSQNAIKQIIDEQGEATQKQFALLSQQVTELLNAPQKNSVVENQLNTLKQSVNQKINELSTQLGQTQELKIQLKQVEASFTQATQDKTATQQELSSLQKSFNELKSEHEQELSTLVTEKTQLSQNFQLTQDKLKQVSELFPLEFIEKTKIAVDTFRNTPALQKGFGLNPNSHELKTTDDYIRYLINKSTDTLIKEVHKVILGQCKEQKRQIKDEEADLLNWMLKTRNLSFNAEDKAHLKTPELGTRFERSEMISTIEVMNGDITKVYVPACPALKLKALVEVNHGQS